MQKEELKPETPKTDFKDAAKSKKVGLGVDVVEIARMRKICKRTPSFTDKMFSKAEIDYCNKKADPCVHFSARFAAKEAVLKALGVGFSEGVGYRDVEVRTKSGGAPVAALHGQAKKIAEELKIDELPISISHTKTEAVCVAIALTKAEKDTSEKSKEAADEITEKFKNLRHSLDQI